jgi:hypothetical protein
LRVSRRQHPKPAFVAEKDLLQIGIQADMAKGCLVIDPELIERSFL